MRRKTVLTKSAITELVKAKDTEGIIKLYEIDKKLNPFDEYKLKENFSTLSHCQKEAIREGLQNGKMFGLAENLYYELKELLNFGKVRTGVDGAKFFVEWRRGKDLIYPF